MRIFNRVVETSFIFPPIPNRNFDWSAEIKDGDVNLVGFGPTERAAIEDLREQAIETYL